MLQIRIFSFQIKNVTFLFCCYFQVVTIKRLCVRKLPPVLAIQLKRFEYDYERDCAIKFNDYFEFPRELDMEPYTGITMFNYFFSSTQFRHSGISFVIHDSCVFY